MFIFFFSKHIFELILVKAGKNQICLIDHRVYGCNLPMAMILLKWITIIYSTKCWSKKKTLFFQHLRFIFCVASLVYVSGTLLIFFNRFKTFFNRFSLHVKFHRCSIDRCSCLIDEYIDKWMSHARIICVFFGYRQFMQNSLSFDRQFLLLLVFVMNVSCNELLIFNE